MVAKTILLIGTLDTKGREYAYVRDLIRARGHRTSCSTPAFWASRRSARQRRSTHRRGWRRHLAELREKRDRGHALEIMGLGARALGPSSCSTAGEFDAVFAMGGSGGTSIGATAMRALPVGMPKLIVSTMASGNVAPYVDVKDITMMYSVVDVAGLNRVSRRILANAAGAICRHGRAGARARPRRSRSSPPPCSASPRPASTASASASNRPATRCSCSTPPAAAAARWRRSSPTASDRRRRRHHHRMVRRARRRRPLRRPDAPRRRGARRASPRWSPSARSTWSTSVPRRRSRRSSATATSTSTTRRSR